MAQGAIQERILLPDVVAVLRSRVGENGPARLQQIRRIRRDGMAKAEPVVITTFKVMRLSRKGIENIKRGLRRSWKDGTHRQMQKAREPDAEGLRKRALWDRKGAHFSDIRMADGRLFCVHWSTLGRTDQVDVFFEGAKVCTCSPSAIFSKIPQ